MSLQPELWLAGDWQHADFADALAWLQSEARCRTFAAASASEVGVPGPPRAVVLAQSRPGQITMGEVERWHAVAPLARLVALLGPWCEGEGRTGQPWPGVVRVPWRSWQARLPRAVGLGSVGLAAETTRSGWQPRTATEWERIVGSVQDAKSLRFRGRVQIHTGSLATFRGWEGILEPMGLKSTWISSGEDAAAGAEIAIFDGWQSVSRSDRAGEGSAGRSRVLVLDWPRPEDASLASSLGFYAVLAQPLLFGDLVSVLSKLLRTSADRQESVA